MNLSRELGALRPVVRSSPLEGFEHVKGFGVFGLPFVSGHVLALRAFPENDFAPYVTVWHRSPEGAWSIFVDGPRLDTACPRYFGAATRHVQFSKIVLTWTKPNALRIQIDRPRLDWNISMTAPPLFRVMNVIGPRLPLRLRTTRPVLQSFEWLARHLFGLGDVTMSGTAPNGHDTMLLPERMFVIDAVDARLEDEDLGHPAVGGPNAAIGTVKLPARPIFAVGQAFFRIRDQAEYARTVAESQASRRLRG